MQSAARRIVSSATATATATWSWPFHEALLVEQGSIAVADLLHDCNALEARLLHAQIIKCGYGYGGEGGIAAVGSALVQLYSKFGFLQDACQVFDSLPPTELDALACNSLASAFAQSGIYDRVSQLGLQMRRLGLHFDELGFSAAVAACAHGGGGDLDQGKQLHSKILQAGFQNSPMISAALVGMYNQFCDLRSSRIVFSRMPYSDAFSYGSMISAYAQQGFSKDALQLFDEMLAKGLQPTEGMFLSVLQAACSGGFVEQGLQYYEKMSRVYGIKPNDQHLACMVELMGRTGSDKNLKQTIPAAKPGDSAWGALLNACKIHGNQDIAKLAADQLIKMNDDKDKPPTYVMMSNIYATGGNWEEAYRIRRMMKEKGLKKDPACSWLDVKNVTYVFFVGDTGHPHCDEIYSNLRKLTGQMKELGYKPNTTTHVVYHDVEEEQKELLVSQHCEKLAIAYGLMSTSPESPLRVYKNLRVCIDCHQALKLMAQISGREIIVRDANRFHHFSDGVCSCRDYW